MKGIAQAVVIAALAGALVAPAFADDAARALVPQEIRARGSINYVTTGVNPPQSYRNEKDENVGIEPEIVAEIAKRLGLKVNTTMVNFDTVITGLQSGRYDVGSAALADSPERRKVVSFLDYFITSYVIVTRAGNPDKLSDLDSFCGKPTIALAAGRPLEMFREQEKKCSAMGKPMELRVMPDPNQTQIDMLAGRSVGTIMSEPRAREVEKVLNGKLQVASGSLSDEYQGIVFPKSSALIHAFKPVLDEMLADGSYKAILDKYKLGSRAIKGPALINSGT